MEATERIYRVEADPSRSTVWWIFGLNIFWHNKPPGVDRLLPVKEWLHCLLGEEAATVLLGGCAIQDRGWPRIGGGIKVDTTLLGGNFYSFSRESRNRVPGVLYPSVDQGVLFSELLDVYAQYDALAILAGVQDTEQLLAVLNDFSGEEEVRRKLRELAQWVVLTQGDAQFLEVESLNPDIQAEIIRCCETADRAVRGVPWFQQAMPQLCWDEEEGCYRLSKSQE